jgi:hypothetical protein
MTRKSSNLMLDPFFKDVLSQTQQNWREVVSIATLNGIPVPAFSASLGYYDSYRAAASPPTSSKPSATSSVPTPTSAPTSRKARCSTRIGRN